METNKFLRLITVIGFLLIPSSSVFSAPPPFCYSEVDGSPSGCYKKLKVSNGALTDNGDGSMTLVTGVGGGGDFSSNTATSVDSELVLFSGTGGKTGKRATTTGIAKLTSGVLSAASAGTDYQVGDATLTSIAALGTAADKYAYTTGIDTWAEGAITSFGRSLIDDAASSNARTTLGLVIGTDVQAYDADLTTWAGITPAAGIGTFLATPSSANLASAVTDETGSGALVFGTSPTIATPVLTLPDGNGSAPTTDGLIKYDRTTERLQVGDGAATREFVDVGTLTDTKLCTWDATGKEIDCNTTAGGGSGATDFNLPIYSAKLTGAFVVFTPPTADACTQGAQIDAGDGNWRLLFDPTTDECATWQFVIPSNYASTPVLNVYYTMTSATSLDVEFEAAIMCVTSGDAADIGTASFSNVATVTETVPGTAGYMKKLAITLTDDSCAAGDTAFIVLSTDANDAANDDATGDREVVAVDFSYS